MMDLENKAPMGECLMIFMTFYARITNIAYDPVMPRAPKKKGLTHMHTSSQ